MEHMDGNPTKFFEAVLASPDYKSQKSLQTCHEINNEV